MATRPGSVRAWRTQGTFVDVGTPRDYLAATRSEGREVEPVIWPGAAVEAGAVLDRCIVTTGVSVPAGFRASEAMLLPRRIAREGDRCEIRGEIAVFPIGTLSFS
jgi:NDP-sugar pyrophosphorylase family protein